MAVPVAAIVKKVAIAILGADEKTKKGIGTAIGTIVIIPMVPVLALVLVLSRSFSDSNFATNAQNRFSENVGAYIQVIDSNLSSILSTMSSAGFSEMEIRAACDIYTLFFIPCGGQDNFVSRYVACFSSEQTAAQLTSNLNSTFGTSVEQSKIAAVLNSLSSTYINPAWFYDTSTKNNYDLARWARMAYEQNWGYVWGTYGNVMTRSALESLSEQYPTHVGASHFHDYIQQNYIGRRCVDCVGLMKSYMWYNFNTGKFSYGSNGFSDSNTETTYSHARVKGPISTIPDIPGIGVYHRGHVGIYIGDGLVIEAMGTRYGMKCRPLSAGSWTNWFYIPGLNYIDPPQESTEETNTTEATAPTETTTTQEENTDG